MNPVRSLQNIYRAKRERRTPKRASLHSAATGREVGKTNCITATCPVLKTEEDLQFGIAAYFWGRSASPITGPAYSAVTLRMYYQSKLLKGWIL